MSSLLVAIPVCHKDADLVLRNLERCVELDGKTRHHAVVSCDSFLPMEKRDQVIAKAAAYFTSVSSFTYSGYRGSTAWPNPQNYAWQNTARHFEALSSSADFKGWLWWEADALPLKPRWLDVLHDAYKNARCPFFGHIVEGRGHMNGVAIYPFNISDYVTRAMLVKTMAFDVMLSEELQKSKRIGRANDFIGHFLKRYGGERATEIETKVMENLPETVVLFHGCTQGTLQIACSTDALPGERPSLMKVLAAWRAAGSKKKRKPSFYVFMITIPKPTLWHVMERHKTDNKDAERRTLQAERSWVELYKRSEMRPCHLWRYPRSSKSMGDSRELPFLKDVLSDGLSRAAEHDIIVLTNDDSILHSEIAAAILRLLSNTDACSSFRVNFRKGQIPGLSERVEDIRKSSKPDIGRDLFAFRVSWLNAAWAEIPDFLLGELEWDLVLAVLVRQRAGLITSKLNLGEVWPSVELERGYVLHEEHNREWLRPDMVDNPAKVWNRRLCREFYSNHGLHEML